MVKKTEFNSSGLSVSVSIVQKTFCCISFQLKIKINVKQFKKCRETPDWDKAPNAYIESLHRIDFFLILEIQ